MDHHWPSEAGLKGMLFPFEVLVVVLVSLEHLSAKFVVNVLILMGGLFGLVLKVEPDGLLEIELHGTALMGSLKNIKDLDVDLWTIEGSVTVVVLPWLAKLIKSSSQLSFSIVPKCI